MPCLAGKNDYIALVRIIPLIRRRVRKIIIRTHTPLTNFFVHNRVGRFGLYVGHSLLDGSFACCRKVRCVQLRGSVTFEVWAMGPARFLVMYYIKLIYLIPHRFSFLVFSLLFIFILVVLGSWVVLMLSDVFDIADMYKIFEDHKTNFS